MNEVLLVAVIALAVALLSIVINLMLVARISVLKSDLDWFDKVKLGDLKGLNSTTYSGLLSLKNETKDAFEKVTNHLIAHDDQIANLVEKYGEIETLVVRHSDQLDQLGQFSGITTGELRVLEQKIYNISKNKQSAIEESKNLAYVKEQDSELFGIRQRVSVLEKKQEDNLRRDSEIEESVSLCHEHTDVNNNQLNRLGERLSVVEIKLAKAFEEFNRDLKDIRRAFDVHKVDLVNHFLELNQKITTGQKIDNVMPEDSKIREYRRKKHKIEYNERVKKMGDPYK